MDDLALDARLVADWRADPVLFCAEALQVRQLDPWQIEVLQAYPRERFIVIPSCHGSGKTFLMACCAWWCMVTAYPFKGAAVSASRTHLANNLWAELSAAHRRMIPALAEHFAITSDLIYLREEPEAVFLAARAANRQNPDVMAGLHADHVAAFWDEAQGIADVCFVTAQGSDSGGNMRSMMAGNPTELSGQFYRACNDRAERKEWFQRRVSYRDSSRVTRAFVERFARIYGPGSNAYRVRCLGMFPTADSRSIIPLNAVEAAMAREVEANGGDVIWGLDVGSKGECPSVLAAMVGNQIKTPMQWHDQEITELVDAIVEIFEDLPPERRPIRVHVDGIGVGDGVPAMLVRRGVPAIHINGGLYAPPRPDRALRAKDAMMFALRRFILDPRNSLPGPVDGSEVLIAMKTQIAAPRLREAAGGRCRMETKSELASREIASPDILDALCLLFAEDWMIPEGREDLGAIERIATDIVAARSATNDTGRRRWWPLSWRR